MADNPGAIGKPFAVLEEFEVKRQIGRAACHRALPANLSIAGCRRKSLTYRKYKRYS
jgi:hypothetical protein